MKTHTCTASSLILVNSRVKNETYHRKQDRESVGRRWSRGQSVKKHVKWSVAVSALIGTFPFPIPNFNLIFPLISHF